MAGSPGDPVKQDPFEIIVAVSFPGPSGGFFYYKHIKFRSGPLLAEGSFDNTHFPPTGALTTIPGGGVGPDPGFTTEGTGDIIKSNSETIALLNSDDSGAHCVTWAIFHEPDPDNPKPTDNQFVGYAALLFVGSSFTQVKADYNAHGTVTSTTPTPRVS